MPDVVLEGPLGLQKKKGLESRYFILTEGYLEYFQTEEDARAAEPQHRGKIFLSDIRGLVEVDHGLVFQVEGKAIRLCELGEGQGSQTWFQELQRLVAAAQTASVDTSAEQATVEKEDQSGGKDHRVEGGAGTTPAGKNAKAPGSARSRSPAQWIRQKATGAAAATKKLLAPRGQNKRQDKNAKVEVDDFDPPDEYDTKQPDVLLDTRLYRVGQTKQDVQHWMLRGAKNARHLEYYRCTRTTSPIALERAHTPEGRFPLSEVLSVVAALDSFRLRLEGGGEWLLREVEPGDAQRWVEAFKEMKVDVEAEEAEVAGGEYEPEQSAGAVEADALPPPEEEALLGERVLFEGYLSRKRKEKLEVRYMVLFEKQLCYWNDREERMVQKKPKGSLLADDVSSIEPLNLGVAVVFADRSRTIELYMESLEQQQEWFEQLSAWKKKAATILWQGSLTVLKGQVSDLRYFVLYDCQFEYYNSEKDFSKGEQPRSRLPLGEVKGVEVGSSGTILVKLENKSVNLRPSSVEELRLWGRKWEEALANYPATAGCVGVMWHWGPPEVTSSGTWGSPMTPQQAHPILEQGPFVVELDGHSVNKFVALRPDCLEQFATAADAQAGAAPESIVWLNTIQDVEVTDTGFDILLVRGLLRLTPTMGTSLESWSAALTRVLSGMEVSDSGRPLSPDSLSGSPRHLDLPWQEGAFARSLSSPPTPSAASTDVLSPGRAESALTLGSASSPRCTGRCVRAGNLKNGPQGSVIHAILCDDRLEVYRIRAAANEGRPPLETIRFESVDEVRVTGSTFQIHLNTGQLREVSVCQEADLAEWSIAWNDALGANDFRQLGLRRWTRHGGQGSLRKEIKRGSLTVIANGKHQPSEVILFHGGLEQYLHRVRGPALGQECIRRVSAAEALDVHVHNSSIYVQLHGENLEFRVESQSVEVIRLWADAFMMALALPPPQEELEVAAPVEPQPSSPRGQASPRGGYGWRKEGPLDFQRDGGRVTMYGMLSQNGLVAYRAKPSPGSRANPEIEIKVSDIVKFEVVASGFMLSYSGRKIGVHVTKNEDLVEWVSTLLTLIARPTASVKKAAQLNSGRFKSGTPQHFFGAPATAAVFRSMSPPRDRGTCRWSDDRRLGSLASQQSHHQDEARPPLTPRGSPQWLPEVARKGMEKAKEKGEQLRKKRASLHYGHFIEAESHRVQKAEDAPNHKIFNFYPQGRARDGELESVKLVQRDRSAPLLSRAPPEAQTKLTEHGARSITPRGDRGKCTWEKITQYGSTSVPVFRGAGFTEVAPVTAKVNERSPRSPAPSALCGPLSACKGANKITDAGREQLGPQLIARKEAAAQLGPEKVNAAVRLESNGWAKSVPQVATTDRFLSLYAHAGRQRR